jgi:signal transduction histidine kinase
LLRWQAGFDVTEVVAEYNILRSCVQDLAESDGLTLTGKVAHIVHRLFDEAVGRAIKAFETMMTIELRHRHGEHVGFILHDLRTPLDAMTLAIALLERSFHKGPEHPTVKSALSVLHGNIARLDDHLRHVLTQEAGLGSTFEAEFTLLNLREQVDRLIHDLSPMATLVSTSVINEVPPEVVVLSETRLLAQILQNLLSNALKFTAQGNISVGAQQAGDGTVTCWVKDTGEGIPGDRLQRVFERFETQGPPERRGIGLGLSIVKEIVELHGGHIWAESELGQGSTFTFVIPNLASD